MKLQTAVLDDTRLYWRNEQGSLTWAAHGGLILTGSLCELGLTHSLHTIWILPGSEVSKMVYQALPSQEGRYRRISEPGQRYV